MNHLTDRELDKEYDKKRSTTQRKLIRRLIDECRASREGYRKLEKSGEFDYVPVEQWMDVVKGLVIPKDPLPEEKE